MLKRFRLFTVAIMMATAFCICAAQQTMDNATVLKLKDAGLSEDLVVQTINASAGHYDTSPDAIIALKQKGLSDRMISAMITKNGGETQPPTTSVKANTPANPASTVTDTFSTQTTLDQTANQSPVPTVKPLAETKPRVFLQADSHGNTVNARRDQSMEMSKDFERDCPAVRISINQQMADYTVVLNHIEIGLFVRDNQIQIADKNGDLISKTKEGGSIANGTKRACEFILADWDKKTNP
jgi:hypothetical protein